MKKTIMYYITIVLTILMIIVSTYSYAADITKESLVEFFDNFVKETETEGTIHVTDTEIVITNESVDEKIQYDLTEKPTFYVDMVFKDGMTYDECLDESSKITLGLFGFCAVAGINGADTNSAMLYYYYSILANTKDKESITEDNFGNVANYVDKIYGEDSVIQDEFFTLSIKKAELIEDEYVVKTELVVNSEADFSIINDEVNNVDNTIVNSIIGDLIVSVNPVVTPATDENENTAENNTTSNTNVENIINNVIATATVTATATASTANITKIPNAGFDINLINVIKIILGLSIAGVIVYSVYNKRYNEK